MSLTADEYRTAAKVAEADGDPDLIAAAGEWKQEASRLDKQEQTLTALGRKATQLTQYTPAPLYVGERLEIHLVATGWTPPEELR